MTARRPAESHAGSPNAFLPNEEAVQALARELVPLVAAEFAAALPIAGALVDADAAGRLMSLPSTWLMAEARANRVPHVRLGRYVRFDVDELRVWWESRRRGPWRSRSTIAATARAGSDPVSGASNGR